MSGQLEDAEHQDDWQVPWTEIRKASHQVGRQLSALRAEQDRLPLPNREHYSLDHVRRLDLFPPTKPYSRPRANRMCAKAHPQPCPYECKTCHFCRQRTTEAKTVCSRCEGVNNFYGGPARGYWCGSCLWLRMGENIDEVRDLNSWVCPACRDLCNCSGANCMRIKRGWFPTNQLSHEAREQGFKSVAHYLVLTHVSTSGAVALQGGVNLPPRPHRGNGNGDGPCMDSENIPPEKLPKTQEDIRNFVRGHLQRRRLRVKGDKQLAAVKRELLWSGKDRGEGVSVLDEVLSKNAERMAKEQDGFKDNVFFGILDQDIAPDDGDPEERGNRPWCGPAQEAGREGRRDYHVEPSVGDCHHERPASDEYVWNGLCIRATSIVKGTKHLPNAPPSAFIAQLQDVLKDAEALLPESVVIPDLMVATPSTTSTMPPWTCGRLRSHGALRRAVHLLTYLSRLLSPEDVEWRIRRRLEGAEPFIDFENSDAQAKAIVVRGQFELLATLIKRGVQSKEGVTSCAKGLAAIARAIAVFGKQDQTPTLLFPAPNVMSDSNSNDHRQSVIQQLMEILEIQLERTIALCPMLGPCAVAFLTADDGALMQALLGCCGLLQQPVFRLGLALIKTVLTTVMQATAFDKRSEATMALCEVTQHTITPLLEAAVEREYPSFRFVSSGTSNSGRRSSMTVSHMDSLSVQSRVSSSEVFEVLALCYALTLRCEKTGWAAIEAAITAPYSFIAFWRQANATYRRIATFVLAHTAAYAAETVTPHAASSLFRVWIQALVQDRHDGMAVASYLTRILATRVPITSPLFAGLVGPGIPHNFDVSEQSSRAIILSRVVKSAMTSSRWAAHLQAVLVDLDSLLVARRKELMDVTPAGQVADAIAQWDWASCNMIVALLISMGGGCGDAQRGQRAKRLVGRLASWVVSSCAYLQARFSPTAAKSTTERDVEEVEDGGIDDIDGPTSTRTFTTVGDVRQRAASLACATLPDLFSVLLHTIAGGDIKALDNDAEALEPLYIIIAGCLEGPTGAIEPTAVDIVIFEKLGAALSVNTSLCTYVMSTFVRRYLERSSLRHVVHQRAAVNALRLVGSVIEHPAVRTTPGRIKSTLFPLIRPILSVLAPLNDAATVASPAAKAAVYDLLTALVLGASGQRDLLCELIPPISPPSKSPFTGPSPTPSTIALHAFWSAVCRDIVSIVANRLGDAYLTNQLYTAKTVIKKHPWLVYTCRSDQPDTIIEDMGDSEEMWFWPVNERRISEASNVVLGALGMPRSTHAVDRLYARPGAASIPASLWEVSQGQGTSTVMTAPDQFRPGDFPWRLASDAIGFLTALCSVANLSTELVGWAWACYPALYFLVHDMKRAMSPLQSAFDQYRSALLALVGHKPLQVFDDYSIHSMVSVEQSSRANRDVIEPKPESKSNPTSQHASGPTVSGPTVSAQAVGPSSLVKIKEEISTGLMNKSLTQLATSTVGTRALIVATLVSSHAVPRPDGLGAAMCIVKDWSGSGGTEAFAKLAVTSPSTATTILKALPGSAIRLEVRVARVGPSAKGGGLGLAAAGKGRVEVYTDMVEVKKEDARLQPASTTSQALSRLVEMGYGEVEARRGVERALKCRSGGPSEEPSEVQQIVSAAVEALTNGR